ncbi:MAG: ABC transporter ATP-binding protein, partial [Oscillospiraceae bacterium]|nr:ABC transporter ATP-binding protein [Oscillospiraceae bacterium]
MKRTNPNPDISYEGNALLRLLAYMMPHLPSFLICLLLVLAVTALDLYRPVLIGDAIDRYITIGDASPLTPQERFSGVLRSGAIYAAILGLLFICNRFQYLIMQKTGQQIIYDIRNTLFQHVQGLTMRFFDITPVGKIVTRLTNDVESVNDVYSNILVRLFQNTVKVIGLACVMLY